MQGYHVTTEKKIKRYEGSKCIFPPVRFWPTMQTAERWAKRTGRGIVIEIECQESYPLPDHKPARWTNETIRRWKVATQIYDRY